MVFYFRIRKLLPIAPGKPNIFEILLTIIILRLKLNFFLSADMKRPPCAIRVRSGTESSKLYDKI
jgi:hypothetical protein